MILWCLLSSGFRERCALCYVGIFYLNHTFKQYHIISVDICLNYFISFTLRCILIIRSSFATNKNESYLPNTPMRQMIRAYPDLAEKVFDKCITQE